MRQHDSEKLPSDGPDKHQSSPNPLEHLRGCYRVGSVLTKVGGGKEQLASSTLTLRTAVCDEDEDFETIDNYKSQLDRERQKWAQRMALRMLNARGLPNGA
jgi:hypothetical protein